MPSPRLTRRALLGGTGVVAASALLAACSGGSGSSGGQGGTPSPGRGTTRSVADFGAVGDGVADDSAAIGRGLAATRDGDVLEFPAGRTYRHTGVVTVATPGVTLSGGGTLLADNERASALRLVADRIVLSGLTLAVRATTRRWDGLDQHRLFIGPFGGIAVRGVTVTGSAAAGVFAQGARQLVLDAVTVADTRADGIHLTGGCRGVAVRSPRVSRSGDDGVAVVSYRSDKAVCSEITVSSPTVERTVGGRGVSVVGGTDISYTDVTVTDSNAAAVYLACEGKPFDTRPTSRVTVTGGTLTGSNYNAAIDHGAVLVYAGAGSVSDVRVSGLTVTGTRPTASRQVGVVTDNGGTLSGITFEKLTLAPSPQPYASNAGAQCCTRAGWTITG